VALPAVQHIESADAAYLASIAGYDEALVTLLGDVATTYIGIRTLETQIKIAQENVVKQKKAVQIAWDKFRGGTGTKLDVYQSENVLGQTEAAIPQLTIQLKQGMNALRVLLGMAPEPLDNLLGRSTQIPVPPRDVVVGIPADIVGSHRQLGTGLLGQVPPRHTSAAGRTSARPNWRPRRRVPRSASPRRISTPLSACSAASEPSPATSTATS
jgi:hypothetical protein